MLFSEPKIPQSRRNPRRAGITSGFSALQRAENSSNAEIVVLVLSVQMFQCSSASRKFLNCRPRRAADVPGRFQCSSASRKFLNRPALNPDVAQPNVSVLFSEPKIPQSLNEAEERFWWECFSALQRAENSSIFRNAAPRAAGVLFQCSSASRKFLNCVQFRRHTRGRWFQCSSASRKFLNVGRPGAAGAVPRVSVLFSEPKIPQ